MTFRVYQPLSLRKGEDAAAALETLRQLAPDLIVVLAYGQLLPKEVLELPKYRCINLHASLLPAYRGAAPIQWVILNGETKTGVTAQQMAEGLDTGDMLVKKEIAIGAEETAEELYERLSELCVETLSETLEQLEAAPCRALRRTMHSPLMHRVSQRKCLHWTSPVRRQNCIT